MDLSKREAGLAAEDRAEEFLKSRGFKTIERNFRCRTGEIDLIAQDGDAVVFVEVRSRASTAFGHPEETIGPVKRARIIRAARYYAYRRKLDAPMRFDVVAVEDGLIRHIPNAFQAY